MITYEENEEYKAHPENFGDMMEEYDMKPGDTLNEVRAVWQLLRQYLPKAGVGTALDYVTKEEKTEEKLVSSLNCQPDTAKEKMQATKELWGKTIAELEKKVSELSSENSELVKELRSKSEMIKSLNARIGTLSESDKVMKQNVELKQLNEQLREEAEAMISSVKEEFARKESELARTQAAADQAKRDAEATRSRQNERTRLRQAATKVF